MLSPSLARFEVALFWRPKRCFSCVFEDPTRSDLENDRKSSPFFGQNLKNSGFYNEKKRNFKTGASG
jgi:hypothetical protein